MKDFDEPGHLAPTGLHLGGTKYMVIQGEPGAVIRGKKVIVILILQVINFAQHMMVMIYLLHIYSSTILAKVTLFICFVYSYIYLVFQR